VLNLRGGDEGLGFHKMRGGENRFLKLGGVSPDGVVRVVDNDDQPSESAVSERRFRAVEVRLLPPPPSSLPQAWSRPYQNRPRRPSTGASAQCRTVHSGVSVSLLEKTIQYIRNQEEHHERKTFQEEFLDLLKKGRSAFDERYLWE